jgi:hypothetical protein
MNGKFLTFQTGPEFLNALFLINKVFTLVTRYQATGMRDRGLVSLDVSTRRSSSDKRYSADFRTGWTSHPSALTREAATLSEKFSRKTTVETFHCKETTYSLSAFRKRNMSSCLDPFLQYRYTTRRRWMSQELDSLLRQVDLTLILPFLIVYKPTKGVLVVRR